MGYKVYLSGSTQEKNIGVEGYGTEETRMQYLADLVKNYISLGQGDIIVYRNNGSMTLQSSISDSNAKNVDLHLAIHSNAGGGNGTEVYYYHKSTNGKGKRFAELIYNAVAPLTIASDNGVMADNVLYNIGLAELRETNAPAALIEVMFHDNTNDVKDYLGKIDPIAKAMAEAIYSYFGITYAEEIPKNVKNWQEILKETSKFSDIWVAFVNNHADVNLKGLIETLYYTTPK